MRINRYIASATGLSRRKADEVIKAGSVTVNGRQAVLSDIVETDDVVMLNGKKLAPATAHTTIVLNKPVGYVCSRDGQGSKSIYELLPQEYQALKTVGRLDKESSGLLVLTDDGQLAYELTHPKFEKSKRYNIALDHDLTREDFDKINRQGVDLDDGPSRFDLSPVNSGAREWQVTMHEGRNRQIRRTFSALGYSVKKLHRTDFGDYQLGNIFMGTYRAV